MSRFARLGFTPVPEPPPSDANRRRFQRLTVPLTEAQATHVAERRAARFRVRIADLSAGGARLFTPRPLNPDDALYVHLPNPENGAALDVPSRVVWVHQGDSGWQMGVESLTLPLVSASEMPSESDNPVQAVRAALADLLHAARDSGDAELLNEGVRVLRAALATLAAGEAKPDSGTKAAGESGARAAGAITGFQRAALTRAVLVPGPPAGSEPEQSAETHERLARALVPLVQAAYEQSRIPWTGDLDVVLERLRGAGLYIPRISHRA